MSILPNQTNINKDAYFFLLVDAKVINTSTINANTGLYDKLFVNTISTGSVLVNNISSLTGNISSLNTNSISSGTGYISSFFSDSIKVSSLIGQTGFISSLFSDNVRVSSIEGQTGFISSLYSDTIKVSSIEAQTANISSLNLNKAYFSSLIGDNISTNYISTNSLNSRSISTINLTSSNISSQNLNSSNIFFDTLNGTAGNITTLTGTDLVYSNIYAQILNADVTVFNSTSIGYLVANNISTAFINSSNGLFTNLFTSTITSHKGIFQSTATGLLIVNNISTGFIYGASALFNNLTASNLNISSFSTLAINVSSINTNSISSGVLNTSNITSYNITNSNLLSNAGDAQFNTLTTAGIVNTNNILNVNGLLALQSDMYGETDNVIIPIPPFNVTQYLKNIYDIKNFTVERIDVVGGATGNQYDPFEPYRNNSIVNIGETELSPGIVSIYGVNAELTYALTVYGLTSITGDTTINGLTTVNGVTDLNGDLTVIGLTSITGDTDIIGLTSITGNTDINGACEITGETNILGLLTAEAGIGIVGATTIQGGDITIGSSSGGVTNNFNLYNYYNGTDIQNLTTNGFGDFRQNVNIDSNLTVGGIIFGTVVSGSESVSTIGVSTLRAFNISTTYLTAGQAFINSISTGSLSGGTGVFNSISTNYISTGILNVSEGIFNSISTNSISTGYISTGSISADVLNFKEATGQLLNLKGEGGGSAGIGLYRVVDGIQEFDTAIVTNNVEGFTILSLSTISIQAEKEINISSLTNINLNTPNGFTNIQYASVGSLYTSTLNVDSIYSFSTLTSTINFNTAKGQLIELQAPPDDTAGLIFYRTIDGVQEPDTIIGIQNSAGFTIQSVSTISIQAPFESIIINSGKILGLAGTELVSVDAPAFVVNSNATISSINTDQITASNVSSIYSQMNYATVLNDLSANNLFTNSLYTIFIGNPLPYQAPITFNANLNISGNDIYNTATLSASNISTNFLSTGSLFVNNYTGDSISTTTISTGSLFVNNYIGNNISTNFLSTGNLFVNNSVENSISSLRISSGSLFSGVISSIQFNASSINANRAFITNLTGSGSATTTTNLYPQSAGSQIGFFGSSGTNSGGFYGQMNARSTITQVIVPDIVGAFSNNIRVQGNLSTQNVFVSTINRKLYPTRSTIGGPFFPSSFTLDGTTATTPQLLISSINFFAGAGNYDISQRMSFIKLSGGNSVDAHGSILVASTNTLLIPDSNTGYGQVPQVNDVGHSTFTTLYTSITVGTNSFQRQYKYLDTTGGNYTGSLYLERPVITYIPSQGLNPE